MNGPPQRETPTLNHTPNSKTNKTSRLTAGGGKSDKSNKRLQRTGGNKTPSRAVATEGDDNSDELRELKFDLQQKDEMLALKTETIKNLQVQLEQQKRRFTTDAQKLSTELTAQNEQLRRKVEDAENM